MLAIIIDLLLIAVVTVLVIQNERIERKLARTLNDRILGDLPSQVDEQLVEKWLAHQLDHRPSQPHLHSVKS